jgi:hypothetical protein
MDVPDATERVKTHAITINLGVLTLQRTVAETTIVEDEEEATEMNYFKKLLLRLWKRMLMK